MLSEGEAEVKQLLFSTHPEGSAEVESKIVSDDIADQESLPNPVPSIHCDKLRSVGINPFDKVVFFPVTTNKNLFHLIMGRIIFCAKAYKNTVCASY